MLTVKSPAKVNLTLDVLGKDSAAGYHFVQTILHEAPLHDEITFEESTTLTLTCDNPDVPSDDSNTILRAARLLQAHTKTSRGARIHLSKKIPLASGLGGPASNAATTLKALSQLWGLNLTEKELLNLAKQIGMDVPFFIRGGCAVGMHYGEQVMSLPTLDQFGLEIELVLTGIQRSAAEAYTALDLTQCGAQNKETGQLVKILKGERDYAGPKQIEALLHNDFSQLQKEPDQMHLSGKGGAMFRLSRVRGGEN